MKSVKEYLDKFSFEETKRLFCMKSKDFEKKGIRVIKSSKNKIPCNMKMCVGRSVSFSFDDNGFDRISCTGRGDDKEFDYIDSRGIIFKEAKVEDCNCPYYLEWILSEFDFFNLEKAIKRLIVEGMRIEIDIWDDGMICFSGKLEEDGMGESSEEYKKRNRDGNAFREGVWSYKEDEDIGVKIKHIKIDI